MSRQENIGEAFIGDLCADWERHGPAAIERMRQEDPGGYIRVIASIVSGLPEVDCDPYASLSNEELVELLRGVRQQLDDWETGGAGE